MTKAWDTSINELLHVFRDSMVALIPPMEKAHISWKQGEAYDDWDEITEALFKNIVARSLAHAFDEEGDPGEILPKYNMVLDSVPSSCLWLDHDGSGGVFIGLSTANQPFDTVDYSEVDQEGAFVDGSLKHVPLSEARLFFRAGKNSKLVNEVSVDL